MSETRSRASPRPKNPPQGKVSRLEGYEEASASWERSSHMPREQRPKGILQQNTSTCTVQVCILGQRKQRLTADMSALLLSVEVVVFV